MKITPKNWNSFQHYKDRKPAWIKLHHALLDDYKFFCLPLASRALAPCIWLLASEYEGGEIDATAAELSFRLHMTEGELCEALNPLIEAGFLTVEQVASNTLAERYQDAIPEKRRDREEDAEPSGSHSEEAELFNRGKKVLGKDAGGLIAKLLKSKKEVPLARAAIEMAATKQNPREYIGRILVGPAIAERPLSPFGTKYPDGII